VSCYCEKLVGEAGGRSGIQRKGKPLLNNGSEDMTINTNVCNSEM
jgi:hypothetical protein